MSEKRNSWQKAMDRMHLLKYKNIFKKEPEERTKTDIESLVKMTCMYSFFRNINSDIINLTYNVHERICRHMRLDFVPKGNAVFHWKDKAQKFYI